MYPEVLTYRTCPPVSSMVPVTPPHQSPPLSSHSPEMSDPTLDSPVVLPKPTTPSAWSSSPRMASCEVIELTSSPSPLPSHLPSTPNYPDSREPDGEELVVDQSLQPFHSAKGDNQDISWLLDEDEDRAIHIISSSPAVPRDQQSPRTRRPVEDDSIVEVDEIFTFSLKQNVHYAADLSTIPNGDDRNSPSRSSDIDFPQASFAVRPVGKRPQTRHIETQEDLWEPTTSPPCRRLIRRDTEIIPRASTPPLQPRKQKKPLISIRHNPWLDGEAEHSGDEVSGGSSHSEDDVESESDRQFLKDVPTTQVSPSYDQFHVYRQSLLTQPPGMQDLPDFANRPARSGFPIMREHSRRPPMVSSSPRREGDEPDEYVFGSFVVADDADLSFD